MTAVQPLLEAASGTFVCARAVPVVLAAAMALVAPHAVAGPGIAIPLDQPGKWQVLEYSGIKPHAVTFAKDGMTLEVDGSASPIIYPLQPRYLSELSSTLEISGDLDLKSAPQGSRGNDDFLFRIGLVYEGDKTLGFVQRAFAAGWVKTLFDLAPEGTGVDRVQFYNVYSDPVLSGSSRTHPDAELIGERFVLKVAADQARRAEGKVPVRFSIMPEAERRVLALWISADGDDTGSQFQVKIRDISLR